MKSALFAASLLLAIVALSSAKDARLLMNMEAIRDRHCVWKICRMNDDYEVIVDKPVQAKTHKASLKEKPENQKKISKLKASAPRLTTKVAALSKATTASSKKTSTNACYQHL